MKEKLKINQIRRGNPSKWVPSLSAPGFIKAATDRTNEHSLGPIRDAAHFRGRFRDLGGSNLGHRPAVVIGLEHAFDAGGHVDRDATLEIVRNWDGRAAAERVWVVAW